MLKLKVKDAVKKVVGKKISKKLLMSKKIFTFTLAHKGIRGKVKRHILSNNFRTIPLSQNFLYVYTVKLINGCMRNTFLFVGAGVVAWWLYEQYQTGMSLAIKLSSLSLGSNVVLGQPLPLSTVFTLSNPTTDTLNIGGINGSIFINGTLVSLISANTTVTVPASSSINYPVNFTVTVNSLLNQLLGIIVAGQRATVSFTGKISVDGISIPYTTSETL